MCTPVPYVSTLSVHLSALTARTTQYPMNALQECMHFTRVCVHPVCACTHRAAPELWVPLEEPELDVEALMPLDVVHERPEVDASHVIAVMDGPQQLGGAHGGYQQSHGEAG